MRFSIINEEKYFFDLKYSWNKLNNKIGGDVFLSFEWNYSWWQLEQEKKKLFIIMATENNTPEPVAIFPFFIDKKKVLRFIGDVHTDYNSFLVNCADRVELQELIKKVVSLLQDNKEIDSIELKNIRQDNQYITQFVHMFDFKQLIYQSNAYSQVEIDSSHPFLQSIPYLKSKHRSELKRIYKRYQNFTSRLYGKEDNFPKDEIRILVQHMRVSKMRDDQFLNDDIVNIIQELFVSGQLIINVIFDDDETVAMNFILFNDKRYLFWIDIYKNIPMINIFSYLNFLETLCIKYKDNPFIIDFGRGLYEYKLSNFFPEIQLQLTFFYAKYNRHYIQYLAKFFIKLSIKNFYKKHKSTINRFLGRA